MSTNDLHRPLYVPDLLANALNQTPNAPLLQLEGGPMLTVRDVRDATSQFIQALRKLGVGPDSRVSILSSNRPEVLHVSHANALLAASSVPMHPLASLADHLYILRDAHANVLVFDPTRFEARAKELAQEIPDLKLIALGESDIAENLCTLAAACEPGPLVPPRVTGDKVTRHSYSGGTTGKPKAMAHNERVGLQVVSILLAEWEWPSPLRVLSCAPLSHAGVAMVLPTLMKQGTMLIQPGFEPVAVMEAIQEYKITSMLVVPTMLYALLDHPRFDEFDLSSLQTVFYGASSISPVRLKEAIERIGPVFFQFYGQAEAPMSITVMRKAEHDTSDMRRLASCGRPVPWVRVELMDSEMNPVPDGEPGEICVQGPLVIDGYRDNPELTAEVFAGGWLHTGDVAVRDPDGFLRIVDRTKDMIVSGGFNIYPREIEDIISQHPLVSQVSVIGVPHEKWGEAVMALIVPRGEALPLVEDIKTLVAEQKGKFQAPKFVEFIDAIPQTPVGKPDKKALRKRFGQASS